jgi:hypothetical protein
VNLASFRRLIVRTSRILPSAQALYLWRFISFDGYGIAADAPPVMINSLGDNGFVCIVVRAERLDEKHRASVHLLVPGLSRSPPAWPT